jgi:YD repeat-containing protein
VGVVTAVVPTVRRIPILGVAPIAATTTTNYDNLGEVTSVTAPGGAVSRYGYDVLGRSVSATAAYGTSLARTSTTEYVGPLSRKPDFTYAELKPYTQNGFKTFMQQLDNWRLPSGETQLWFYNRAGVIGSSGFNY